MLPALAMAGPVSVWMILFVTIPMLYIIYISFMSRGVFGDVVYKFSTESYKTILDPTYFKVILKSLKAAGITTILCLLLGYPLAYIIAHKPKDTAAKLITLIMIPFWTNSLMRLNSWLLLFQTSGPINNFLVGTGIVKEPITFIYTDGLVLIGLITNMLPFAVLPLYSTIEKLDKSLIEASADLGASAATTFMRVTLPITFPGIFSAGKQCEACNCFLYTRYSANFPLHFQKNHLPGYKTRLHHRPVCWDSIQNSIPGHRQRQQSTIRRSLFWQ